MNTSEVRHELELLAEKHLDALGDVHNMMKTFRCQLERQLDVYCKMEQLVADAMSELNSRAYLAYRKVSDARGNEQDGEHHQGKAGD